MDERRRSADLRSSLLSVQSSTGHFRSIYNSNNTAITDSPPPSPGAEDHLHSGESTPEKRKETKMNTVPATKLELSDAGADLAAMWMPPHTASPPEHGSSRRKGRRRSGVVSPADIIHSSNSPVGSGSPIDATSPKVKYNGSESAADEAKIEQPALEAELQQPVA